MFCALHTALEKHAFPIEQANGNVCIFSLPFRCNRRKPWTEI